MSINPGLILGPSLAPASESGSLFLLDELLPGDFFYGAPAFSFTTVDVRDVALAHIRASELTEAHGRYIANHLGIEFRVDNRRSIVELGMRYRPIQKTVVDHYRTWAEHHGSAR